MLSEVMSWREAPLKFSPRVTAARGIVSTNPTGRTSVRLSAHRFAAVSNLSPLAHRPSTRSGRPIKGGRNIPCCFLVGVVVRHPLLKKKGSSSSGHPSPKGKANILLILNQQEKERKGVTQTGQRASWLMFSGVHLSVIVNDSNKVAPVTDLSRVRLGQEIQNVSEINFFERRLWEMHGKPPDMQSKFLNNLSSTCNV